MLQFFCPGCRAEHKANDAFSGKRAQCVRCGAAMRIPKKTGMTGMLIPAPMETDDELNIDEYAEKHGGEIYTPTDDSVLEAIEPVADTQDVPRSNNKRNKRIGLIALVLLILGAVYYFTLSDAPKKKTSPTVVPEEVEEPPPPPPVEPVVVMPPKPPELPEEVIPFTADRFMLEYSMAPRQFDELYKGKLLEIFGTCHRLAGNRLFFRNHNSKGDEEQRWVAGDIPGFLTQPEQFTAFQTVMGIAPTLPLERPAFLPTPGRPAAIQGRYVGFQRLSNASLVRITAPADVKYLLKTVSVTGIFERLGGHEDGTPLYFQPQSTTELVEFECLFRPALRDLIRTIPKGKIVTITGVCSGRLNTTVRLDNCVLGGGGLVATTALQIVKDYEFDIRPISLVEFTGSPLQVSAEQLARDFQQDSAKAREKYCQKFLAVTGTILDKNASARLLTYELGTDLTVKVVSAFTQKNFALISPDEPVLGVRCQCFGLNDARIIRLESCEPFDPDDGNPNVPRLTPDYFPMKAGTEWTTLRILEPNVPPLAAMKPSAKPTKLPAEPVYSVLKLNQRMIDEGRMQISLLHQGKTTDRDLTKATIKWQAKPLKTPRLMQTCYFRAFENNIELGTPLKQPPTQTPKSAFDLFSWEPYLRIGAKNGRSWTYEDKDNGNMTQTTVTKCYTDTRNRQTFQIDTIITSAKLVGVRQITTTTYAKGVGITSQKMVRFNPQGEQFVHYEEIREEPELTAKRESELRGGIPMAAVTRETAPAPRNGK